MCIQKLFNKPDVPIFIGNEHPNEHNVLSVKENHGSVKLLFIASRESIGEKELYHQVGDRVMDQIVVRQSLLDAVNGSENTVLTQATSGYLFGRSSNNGEVIVDGVVFAEDSEPGLLRLDPRRTLNGILEDRMRTLGVTLVGTISYADYSDWSITERGLTEKITDMPHMFVLARGSTSYSEVAVITPKEGGGEVHAGVGIVEHGGSIEWGIVTSVREIKEPAIEVRLL
jgi:hypothetical protein